MVQRATRDGSYGEMCLRPGNRRHATLVLLHGFTGHPGAWRDVAARIRWPGRVLALSLPGHHPAFPVAAGWSANVAAMAEVLRHAGEERCALVGYSMGGRLALGLASEAAVLGLQVETVVLIGAHPGLPDAGERRQRRAQDQVWQERLRGRGLEDFVRAWAAQPIFSSQRSLPSEVLSGQQRARCCHDPEALAQALEEMGLAAMPAYALTPPWSTPVLCAAGAKDERYRQVTEAMCRGARWASRVVIEGAGHNPVLEAPEATAEIVSEWLSRREPDTDRDVMGRSRNSARVRSGR